MSFKYKVKWIKVEEDPQEGDYVMEWFTGKVGILGKTGYEGFSRIYNLNGTFYDCIDMFDKVIPNIIEKKSFLGITV